MGVISIFQVASGQVVVLVKCVSYLTCENGTPTVPPAPPFLFQLTPLHCLARPQLFDGLIHRRHGVFHVHVSQVTQRLPAATLPECCIFGRGDFLPLTRINSLTKTQRRHPVVHCHFRPAFTLRRDQASMAALRPVTCIKATGERFPVYSERKPCENSDGNDIP